MGLTKLRGLVRQSALISPMPDDFWPLPDQYIGLEMELEGQRAGDVRAHRERGAPFWTDHQDGSLRNGIEYVLSQPLMGAQLRQAIDYFYDNFKTFTPSPRTSIHVHMNMRQENETIEGLRNLVVLYYMFEKAFFHIADENRKWSAYCNAFEDIPPEILNAVVNEERSTDHLFAVLEDSAGRNQNRYYGLNLNALHKFGTLEFRHFPLVADRERLVQWLRLLMELKAAANRMAERETSPWKLFEKPEDVHELPRWMPEFGEQLLQYVTAGQAFVRMVNVRGLALPQTYNVRQNLRLSDNTVYKKFIETQAARGVVKKAKATKPKAGGPVFDPDIFNRLAGQTAERDQPRVRVRDVVPQAAPGEQWIIVDDMVNPPILQQMQAIEQARAEAQQRMMELAERNRDAWLRFDANPFVEEDAPVPPAVNRDLDL